MTLIWPWMLLSLLLLPFLGYGYWRLQERRRRQAEALGRLGLAQDASGQAVGRRRHIPAALFGVGIMLLLFSLARPELPVSLPRVEGTVILAFDISNSMAADDFEPTRLEAAKEAARIFIENQPPAVRVGIVVFSNGGIEVQAPTEVKEEALATIDRIQADGSTSLGAGIFASLSSINGEPLSLEFGEEGEFPESLDMDWSPSSVIVLLTDGENTDDPDPIQMAQFAADAGVRIYPVGVGSPEGVVLDVDGFSVVTALDETTLEEIANLTNGAYFRAEDPESLREIYENIDLRLTIRGEQMEVTSLIAAVSLLLLILGGGLSLLWFGRVP